MSNEYRTYVTTFSSSLTELFCDLLGNVVKGKVLGLKLILENQLTKSQINTELQQEFKINKRLANSIFTFVEGKVKSARECRTRHFFNS